MLAAEIAAQAIQDEKTEKDATEAALAVARAIAEGRSVDGAAAGRLLHKLQQMDIPKASSKRLEHQLPLQSNWRQRCSGYGVATTNRFEQSNICDSKYHH